MNAKGEAWVRLGVVGVLLLGALLLVSGCSSNTSSGTALPNQNIFVVQGGSVSTFPLTASGNAAPSGTLSGAHTGFTDAHRLAFDSLLNGYVTNCGSCVDEGLDSIMIYAPGTSGNTVPTATISGAATGLSAPFGIDLDAHNNIYVANDGGGAVLPSVAVYAAGSTGNVAPAVVISGADTGLDGPNGLALDSGANIYVANESNSTVVVFAAGSAGDAAPLLTIVGAATGISRPHDLTVDPGGNLYVTNSFNNSVTIYTAGDISNAFTATVNCIAAFPPPPAPPPTPAQQAACSVQDLVPGVTMVGAATALNNPNGIAFDASGNFYVTNNLSGVMIYAASTIGAAITAYNTCETGPPAKAPAACKQTLDKAPVATITGADTGFEDVHGVSIQQTQVLI